MTRNIFVPFKLKTTKLTIPTNGKNLLEILNNTDPDWYNENEQKLLRCNSVRFYVSTGPVGFLMDGNIASLTNSLIVEEGLQNIENVEISNINIVGPGEIVIQIGNIA